ncbi:MAG: DUF3147 family protein [Spartobacteria bacterium]
MAATARLVNPPAVPYLIKIILSALMIVAITEATKRLGVWGALLAALPVLSLISMLWIYWETKDTQKIASFSLQVFWFVIPSLGLFASLPWLLTRFSFFASLGLASMVTILLYVAMLEIFKLLGYDPFS